MAAGDMWLDRTLLLGPYLALCTNEKDFREALDDMGVPAPHPPFLATARANATTTSFFDNTDGKLCAVVSLGSTHGRSGIEIAGLLVHEATHVWQEYRNSIGEKFPGSETEAYAIQQISQQLMWRYAEIQKEKEAHANA